MRAADGHFLAQCADSAAPSRNASIQLTVCGGDGGVFRRAGEGAGVRVLFRRVSRAPSEFLGGPGHAPVSAYIRRATYRGADVTVGPPVPF